jgi:tetratricopeptide (TPR) repeat protein
MSASVERDTERKAVALLEMGRHAEAAVLLGQVLAQDPGRWIAAALLSTAEARQGHFEASVAAAEQAVTLAPEKEWAHRTLAIAYTRTERGDDAKREATMAVHLAPQHFRNYIVLVNALLLVSDREGAREAAEKAIALNPTSVTPFIQMSAAAAAAEDWELAELASRNALSRDPESVVALNNLGASLMHQKRVKEGVKVYEQAIRLDPNYAPVRNMLAQLSVNPEERHVLSRETLNLMEIDNDIRPVHPSNMLAMRRPPAASP